MPPKSGFMDNGKPLPSIPGPDVGQRLELPDNEQTRDNLIVASKFIDIISGATDLIRPLKATCQVLKLAIETTQAVKDNREEWDALKRKLESHLTSLADQCRAIANKSGEITIVEEGLFNPLKAYVLNLESLQDAILSAQAQRSGFKGLLKNISGVRIEAGLIRTYTRDIDDRFREFTSSLQIFMAELMQRMNKTVQRVDNNVDGVDKKVDRLLAIADANALKYLIRPRASKPGHVECLRGTRVPILDKIREWSEDASCERQIFWLNDVAGSGKSTVATTMANEWRRKNHLCGRFFFSMSDEDFSGTAGFCSAIARDLHAFIPSLRSTIQDAAASDTTITTRSFNDQFNKLIAEPLRSYSQTVVLVIDAIDECKDKKERKTMLETIINSASTIPHLRVFMTSRPEPDISAIISPAVVVYNMEFHLHGMEHQNNVDDIAAYIKYHLSTILVDQQQNELVEKAGGLFIWASTAKKILEERPNKASEIVTALLSTRKSPELSGIDSLYELVLRRALPSEGWLDLLRGALGVLAVVNEPISIATLSNLMPVKGRLAEIISRLGSVLKVDGDRGRIHFRHPTFREFLYRCDSSPLSVDTGKAHVHVAITTLRLLGGLKMDVLDIWKDGSRAPFSDEVKNIESLFSSRIGETTLYSAKYWAFHSGFALDNTELLEAMKRFLKAGLLNWLELVVWMRNVAKALSGLLSLRKMLGEYADHSGDHALVQGWVNEATKFAQSHQIIIERAALHVHTSAVLFSPQETWIYDTYKGATRRKMPTVLTGLAKTWPTHHILAGHSREINCLSFSPDGKHIISGSSDKTLRLWDAESGAQVGSVLEGHSGHITCLAFSPDGRRVVSGSNDETLRLWDVDSSAEISIELKGHSDVVGCLAFLPDGKRVVSGCRDKTLRLWDTESGSQIGSPLEGHSDWIHCLAFLPDGKRVVSGSNDNTLRRWDVESGTQIGSALEGHSRGVKCLALSPDGKRVVSGSYDKTLRLWDMESGAQIGNPFEGHSARVDHVVFSPDGKYVVSGSADKTLRLWDTESGAQVGSALEGHSGHISCLAFSPDGIRVVSGSACNVIRIWRMESGAWTSRTLEGHSGSINCLSFSPGGKQIISGSNDHTLRIWDVDSGPQINDTLEKHSGGVKCLAFSPDGKCVVSGSYDATLRFWDVESGAQIGSPLEGHSASVNHLVFSPNGERVVSGSDDNTLRIWDAKSGAQIGSALEGHLSGIHCLAFSPDGRRVVSSSLDTTLRLWDIDSGVPIGGPFDGRSEYIMCMLFSPDGKRVVSGSHDNTLRLWDAESGGLIATLNVGNTNFATHPRFSPDSSTVYFEGRKWRMSSAGLVEKFDEPPISSQPPNLSPITYDRQMHAVAIPGRPEHTYLLPLIFSVSIWKVCGDVVVLGTWDGLVMIIDFSGILRGGS